MYFTNNFSLDLNSAYGCYIKVLINHYYYYYIALQLHEVLGGRSTNSNRDACGAEGVGCPLGGTTCTESPCQPFGMSSA